MILRAFSNQGCDGAKSSLAYVRDRIGVPGVIYRWRSILVRT
jgi:hypothetical protein